MIRIAYSLLLCFAIVFGLGKLALGQSNQVKEQTSEAAASLKSTAADSTPAAPSSAERTTNKSISNPNRESAKRSYKAGVKYERGGLSRQAVQSLEQAIAYDPEFADAYAALGQSYISLGRYDDAVVALEKALTLNPKVVGAYTLLGQAYTKLKTTNAQPGKTNDANADQPTTLSSQPDNTGTDIDAKAVYFVGISDVLDIRIPGNTTDESTLYVVSNSGQVDHPILGQPIKVSGLTTDQIAARFSAELKRLSIGDRQAPEVTVRDYNSHTIMVSGLVKEPGTKVLRREAIPLYVVLADAQLLPDAALVDVMTQNAVKHRTVDLSDPEQTSVLVRPGEVVAVKAAAKRFFYVGGNVKSPGELPFRSGLTLTQAILSAGGVSLKGDKVQLTRGQGNGLLTLQEFKLKEINRGKIPDPLIEPGDRITVLP